MRGVLPAPPSPEEERVLLERMALGDAAARDELIERNLLLVKHIALGLASTGIEYEERFSLGCVGLICAVDHYDASRGKLSTYVARCAKSQILMALRYRERKKRAGGAVSLDTPVKSAGGNGRPDVRRILGDVLPSKEPQPIERIEAEDERRAVRAAVAALPEQWRRFLEERYLSADGVKRQRAVADAQGLKQSNASRIEIAALARCRAALEGMNVGAV